jgi:general secretion pathway protein E
MVIVDAASPPSQSGSLKRRFVECLAGKVPRGDRSSDEVWPESAPPLVWATRQGYSEEQQLEALAAVLGVPLDDCRGRLRASPDYVRQFEIAFSRKFSVLGLADEPRPPGAAGNRPLRVAVCTWSGWRQLDVIARVLDRPVQPVVSTRDAVEAAIDAAYEERTGEAQELLETLDENGVPADLQTIEGKGDLLDNAGLAPVIKLVNLMLFEAVKERASDIHLQPYEDRLVVRQRIDGVLFDCFEIPKTLQEEVITRIKVLGRMNVAEKRLPQDGRATVKVGQRHIDLRIASLPTSHRERIVIRLLDKSARLYTLGELGMRHQTLARFRQLIQLDHGLILVTGPTGSGKSTTLYAALQEINSKDQNVLTIEDPIEYQLDGISQSQVNERKGLTFASGLRNVLRQDPDIIMVGEIRDEETAVMAIQASLTGHLVFSTLHTNDAAGAVTRLLDLGIEPYLVSSSLVAALAQRLVRRICPHCRTEADSGPADGSAAESHRVRRPMYVGRGCPECRGTGYRGRFGLFELLVMDDRCREIVQSRGNAPEIRRVAVAAGMELLEEDGMAKVFEGLTTYAEVLRVAKTGSE